jgi:hypothetical protein
MGRPNDVEGNRQMRGLGVPAGMFAAENCECVQNGMRTPRAQADMTFPVDLSKDWHVLEGAPVWTPWDSQKSVLL